MPNEVEDWVFQIRLNKMLNTPVLDIRSALLLLDEVTAKRERGIILSNKTYQLWKMLQKRLEM